MNDAINFQPIVDLFDENARLRAELAKLQAVVDAVKEKCRDVLRFRPNTDNVAMDFDLDGARSMARWVLRTLDGEPCQTCEGSGEKVVEGYDPRYADTVEAEYPCPTRGGDGTVQYVGPVVSKSVQRRLEIQLNKDGFLENGYEEHKTPMGTMYTKPILSMQDDDANGWEYVP